MTDTKTQWALANKIILKELCKFTPFHKEVTSFYLHAITRSEREEYLEFYQQIGVQVADEIFAAYVASKK